MIAKVTFTQEDQEQFTLRDLRNIIASTQAFDMDAIVTFTCTDKDDPVVEIEWIE